MARRKSEVPEDSAPARVAIWIASEIGIAAVALTTGMWLQCASTMVLVTLGHRRSWQGRRRARGAAGRWIIGLLLLGAIVYLVADLFGSAFGGVLPQVTFALMAMAITSFDLKTRRNLYSHLWHSLVLLYVGGIFAWSIVYLGAVVPWGAAMGAFMALTSGPPKREPRPAFGSQRRWFLPWLLSASLIFVALPELPGRPIGMAIVAAVPSLHGQAGEALPPILPLIGSGGQPGIDLRARGALGDEVVFHVRATSASYWRAYALEIYNGVVWGPAYSPGTEFNGELGTAPTPAGEAPSSQSVSQTFFIDRNLGSEVIAAYPITHLYFPAPLLRMSGNGTVEAPYDLAPGTNYAAVSAVRDVSPSHLRQLPFPTYAPQDPNLSLPYNLPVEVRALAQRLSAGAGSEYDKVMAITQYLQANYSYQLDSPRVRPGNDAVDQFLFQDRRGFCEQFASSLAVMLRSVGIPARLAVGYASGERDLFTGTFTVRNRDAHAWTEVYFPSVGWLPFDATPGSAANPGAQPSSPWLLDVSGLASLGGVPQGAPIVGGLLLAALLIAAAIWGLRKWRRECQLSPALRRYGAAQQWLRWAGLPARQPAQTLEQHLQVLARSDVIAARELEPICDALYLELYGGEQVSPPSFSRLRTVMRNRL